VPRYDPPARRVLRLLVLMSPAGIRVAAVARRIGEPVDQDAAREVFAATMPR
jgi:hypothetical protein